MDQKKLAKFSAFDPLAIPEYRQASLGEGSIGGKAKGMLFAREALKRVAAGQKRESDLVLPVVVPESHFVPEEFFDQFLALNHLENLRDDPEAVPEYQEAFLRGEIPVDLKKQLLRLLEQVSYPLAVRSSSLLEDNPEHSFAGKYLTTFLANNVDLPTRLKELETAIKMVYASTYGLNAIEYRLKHGLTGEKMAVIVQRLEGRRRRQYFYPEISGVGFSKAYRRWTERIRAEDGVMRIAFGLGTRCTGRGYARTLSLTNPRLRPEGNNPADVARYSQETIDVLDLEAGKFVSFNINERPELLREHRHFHLLAQLYNGEENSLQRVVPPIEAPPPGQRYVFTFHGLAAAFPQLFQTTSFLYEVLEEEMGTPVDIEFTYETADQVYSLVQARPLSSYEEYRRVTIPPDLDPERILLKGDRMLTNGVLSGVRFLVYVDYWAYAAAPNKGAVAREIGRINRRLAGERYILVGPGRWGSTDPLLGVPVTYQEISNAGLLVEVGISHQRFAPELSYGTHFFADLEADRVLYLPVFDEIKTNIFNRQWFDQTPSLPTGVPAVRIYEGKFSAYLDSHTMQGVVVAESS